MKCVLYCSITAIFYLSGLWAEAATVLGCDKCSPSLMRTVAENSAMRMRSGSYEIKVLNISDAEYHLYQALVIRHASSGRNTDDEVQVLLNRITLDSSAEVKRQLISYRNSIEDLKTALSGSKIILPDVFPYRSAAEALQYPDDFANALGHFLNREHSGVQRAIFDIRAIAETLAANMQIGIGAIFSASTSLTSGTSSTAIFADGSELDFYFNFTRDSALGLKLEITLRTKPAARDANGRPIPANPVEARNYAVASGAIDIQALANYLMGLGINIKHNRGGNICIPDSFGCDSTGARCTVTYRCTN